MRLKKLIIANEKLVFDDRIKIRKAEISGIDSNDQSVSFSRLKIDREDAAAVLLWDPAREKVILIRQYRYAVANDAGEALIELVAGKLDGDEDPLHAAIRETEEEAGYRINPARIKKLCSYYASPGYTSETYHLFLAEVSEQDRISVGGGLEQENEYIERIEMGVQQFISECRNGIIKDGKTVMSSFYLDQLI